MKVAFVSKVKEKDLKKLFPWAKKTIPVLGGFIVTDASKISQLQKELVRLAQKELDAMVKRDRERAEMEKRFQKKMKGLKMSGPRVMIHG